MDQHLKQDVLLEEALKSQPLAEMPRSITVEVMRHIQTDEAKRPAILAGSDVVLGFVIASCIAAFWFAAQNLPPILLVKLRIQGILLYQDFLVNSRWLVPSAMFVLAAFLAAMTIPTLIKMTMDRRR
jgi:hypothetical protein